MSTDTEVWLHMTKLVQQIIYASSLVMPLLMFLILEPVIKQLPYQQQESKFQCSI